MLKYVKIALIIFLLCNIAFLWALMQRQKYFYNVGYLKGINIDFYSDYNCTQPIQYIDWGTLYPNMSITKTIYIKNTGNSPITISCYVGNWTFIDYYNNSVIVNASDYFDVTINTLTYLDVNQVTPCNITLIVKANDYIPFNRFSFIIYFIGTENA